MNTPRVLLLLLSACALAGRASAQTATWIGQNPPDRNRLSSWTDGANWSTGTAPAGSSAVAHVDQAYATAGGLVGRDKPQVLNADVTLDTLEFGLYSPTGSYSDPAVDTPSLMIGGTGLTDRGSLTLSGDGIRPTNPSVNFFPRPSLLLHNGDLTFTNQAAAAVQVILQATTGNNQILFADDSVVQGARILLGDGSRLTLRDRARLTGTEVGFAGGNVVAANNALVQDSYFTITGAGLLEFSGQSQASNVVFTFARTAPGTDSIVRFSGQARWTGYYGSSGNGAGSVEFTDQANTWGSTGINGVRRVDISGASTGTGSTGRIRAATNDLAPSTVVADDARTVTVGNVSATDLLLGSNTLQLSGGSLYTIRDTGGAYLSTNGANLAGGGLVKHGTNYLYLMPGFDQEPYAVPLTVVSGVVQNHRQRLGAVTISGTFDPNSSGALHLYAGTLASLTNSGYVYLGAATTPISGDFTQTGTGRLAIPISHAATNRLLVAGTARLGGALLSSYSLDPFVGSKRHVILTANQLIGRFDTTPDRTLSPMLSAGVEYSGNEVFFTFTQRPFVNAGATASQQALGAHLDGTLDRAAGEFYHLVLRLNTLQDPALIAAGLGQLAPDRYGVLNEQGFTLASSRQALLDRRLAGWRSTPGTDRFMFFADASRVQNRFAAVEGLTEVDFDSGGGIAGAAVRWGRWTLGVSASKDTAKADLDGLGSTARIASTAPGLFAQYEAGRFFLSGAASRSVDRYTLVRNSGLLSRLSWVTAAPRGTRTDLSLTAGTILQRKTWSLTPYAGVLASQVRLDDFAEGLAKGAPGTELAFTRWSVGSLRTRAGFDLAGQAGRITPRFSLVWLHELEKDRGLSAGFVAAGGARYRAPGRPAETDLVQSSLGLDWRLTRHLGFSLSAGFAQGKNTDTTSDLAAGFRWEF